MAFANSYITLIIIEHKCIYSRKHRTALRSRRRSRKKMEIQFRSFDEAEIRFLIDGKRITNSIKSSVCWQLPPRYRNSNLPSLLDKARR